jgi:hypothetical protein
MDKILIEKSLLENLLDNTRELLNNNLGYMGQFTKWYIKDREEWDKIEDTFKELKNKRIKNNTINTEIQLDVADAPELTYWKEKTFTTIRTKYQNNHICEYKT